MEREGGRARGAKRRGIDPWAVVSGTCAHYLALCGPSPRAAVYSTRMHPNPLAQNPWGAPSIVSIPVDPDMPFRGQGQGWGFLLFQCYWMRETSPSL